MYRININELPRDGVSKTISHETLPALTSISPNPTQTNVKLKIGFWLPRESEVSINLYDELGRQVKTLLKEFSFQGQQTVDADISGLSSGVYYVVLTSDGHSITQKVTITK